MPATEKQVEANRKNALKSTGPRSPEGKARSRANALKHGLTGSGIVLPEEDRLRWEGRAESWAEELGARGELDLYLAGRAALASVRLDRCVRAETADLQARRDAALTRWDYERARNAQVDHWARVIASDPAAAVAGLRRTTPGCEWLTASWTEMAAEIEASGWWTPEEARRALGLLGRLGDPHGGLAGAAVGVLEGDAGGQGRDGPRADGRGAVGVLRHRRPLGARPARHRRGDRRPGGPVRLATRRSPPAARARWEAWEGADRQAAIDRVLVDDTPGGMLRRRYESASTSELHRSLDQVHKNQRAAGRASCETDPIPDFEGHEPTTSKPDASAMAVILDNPPVPPEPPAPLRNEPNPAIEPASEVVAVSDVSAGGLRAVSGAVGSASTDLRNEPNPPALDPFATIVIEAPSGEFAVAAALPS